MFSLISRQNTRLVNSLVRSLSASSVVMGKKVALVLSGCGVYDGTEIHEASACLVHLSRHDAEVKMYAPDIELDEIDHTKGEPTGAKRNVLTESARIARGPVIDIKDLKATNFDAVVFPGGFGAAKNLCTFATDGANCKVNPDVERILKEFHAAKKPIGLCCIAPVLAAKVLKSEVTIGFEEGGTAKAIESMGAKHKSTNIEQFHTDTANKVITSGAFMFGDEAGLHKIFDNVGLMIKKTIELA